MSLFRSSTLTVGLAFFASLAAAANFEVTVGKDNKLEFNPSSLKAQIGDTVTYKFFSKVRCVYYFGNVTGKADLDARQNHAVAQSTFADPCHLQDNGIFSGFTPNPSSDTAAPTDFTITINDTKPLWFYW
jgi:plastocyanin